MPTGGPFQGRLESFTRCRTAVPKGPPKPTRKVCREEEGEEEERALKPDQRTPVPFSLFLDQVDQICWTRKPWRPTKSSQAQTPDILSGHHPQRVDPPKTHVHQVAVRRSLWCWLEPKSSRNRPRARQT